MNTHLYVSFHICLYVCMYICVYFYTVVCIVVYLVKFLCDYMKKCVCVQEYAKVLHEREKQKIRISHKEYQLVSSSLCVDSVEGFH